MFSVVDDRYGDGHERTAAVLGDFPNIHLTGFDNLDGRRIQYYAKFLQVIKAASHKFRGNDPGFSSLLIGIDNDPIFIDEVDGKPGIVDKVEKIR